jgi:hypothetical protein
VPPTGSRLVCRPGCLPTIALPHELADVLAFRLWLAACCGIWDVALTKPISSSLAIPGVVALASDMLMDRGGGAPTGGDLMTDGKGTAWVCDGEVGTWACLAGEALSLDAGHMAGIGTSAQAVALRRAAACASVSITLWSKGSASASLVYTVSADAVTAVARDTLHATVTDSACEAPLGGDEPVVDSEAVARVIFLLCLIGLELRKPPARRSA